MPVKSIVRKALARMLPSLDPDVQKANLVGKPVGEIFATIYQKKLWGGRLSFGAHSGNGSRNKVVIAPYISAVRKFLMNLDRPSVVDFVRSFNISAMRRLQKSFRSLAGINMQ